MGSNYDRIMSRHRDEKNFWLEAPYQDVRHFRTKKGLSRKKLAELSGLSEYKIRIMEEYKGGSVSIEDFCKVMDVLGLKVTVDFRRIGK